MRKRGGKPIVCCFVGGEKPPKPSQENGGGKLDKD